MTGFDIGGYEGLPRARLLGGDAIPDRSTGDGDDSRRFASTLADALEEVNRLGTETKDKAAALARGEPVEIHELMIAMGKSEVAFNLMLEIRNKMIEAWQHLSRSVI